MSDIIAIAAAALEAACAAASGVGQAPAAKPASAVLTGRCHCGAIAYEAHGPIVKSSYCDCRGCQRASGSLKAPYVTVLRDGFQLTAGKPATFQARSDAACDQHGTWHFCPKCGAPLFWKADRGDELDLFAGSLDDPSVFQPKE